MFPKRNNFRNAQIKAMWHRRKAEIAEIEAQDLLEEQIRKDRPAGIKEVRQQWRRLKAGLGNDTSLAAFYFMSFIVRSGKLPVAVAEPICQGNTLRLVRPDSASKKKEAEGTA